MVDYLTVPSGDPSAWLQMCSPNAFPKPSSRESEEMRSDLKRCKNAADAADVKLQVKSRLQVEAKAGGTYYVKWSITGRGGKMEPMDEAKGAKEMHRLHPAKD
jgi:hypothetical protein